MSRLIDADNILELAIKLQNNNSIDKKRCIDYYLEKKARLSAVPFRGTFELTPLCNLDCKMCYIHLNNSVFNVNNLLPTNEWIHLMKEAHSAGMMKATLTGGECLTYPGFDEVYSFLYSKGIDITILSNGLLMNDARIDFFRKRPPRFIQISLYGYSDDSYERVTGSRVFNTVRDNVLNLHSAGFRLLLMITPSIYMDNDIYSIIEFAESLKIPYAINSRLIHPRKGTGREKKDLTIERYIEIYKYQSTLKHINLSPVDLEETPNLDYGLDNKKGLNCGGGRSSFTIQYDGNMSPCSSLYEVSAKPLLVGFDKAWKTINKIANNLRLPIECYTCKYSSVCITCPAMHMDAETSGHCNPQICQLIKKLIQEGLLSITS